MSVSTQTEIESPDCVSSNITKQEKEIPTYGKYQFYIWEFETPIIWTNVFFITLWHLIAVWTAFKYPFWRHWGLLVYGIAIGGIGGFGITAGVHRLWTHKSYKATLPLKIILLICYCIAGQNSVVQWVRDHRVHHKFTETHGDPHNSKRGFFFAHVGWLMMKRHPEVIRKGRMLDMSDVLNDPLVAFFERHFIWLKLVLCFILPSVIPPYFFGENLMDTIMCMCFLRYILTLNFTWFTNSVAHLWGDKPYDKRIGSVENLTVSFLAMGEGYHNYHHTFPWDYRTSEFGRKLNVTTFWLNIFQYIGWAYDLKTPSPELVRQMMETHGDGSHFKWGHEVPEEENSRLTKMKTLKKSLKSN